MPRYHFHISDPYGLIVDEEGSELPNLQAAREEAAQSLRELVAEAIKTDQLLEGRTLRMCDPEGNVLAEFPFKMISQ